MSDMRLAHLFETVRFDQADNPAKSRANVARHGRELDSGFGQKRNRPAAHLGPYVFFAICAAPAGGSGPLFLPGQTTPSSFNPATSRSLIPSQLPNTSLVCWPNSGEGAIFGGLPSKRTGKVGMRNS